MNHITISKLQENLGRLSDTYVKKILEHTSTY